MTVDIFPPTEQTVTEWLRESLYVQAGLQGPRMTWTRAQAAADELLSAVLPILRTYLTIGALRYEQRGTPQVTVGYLVTAAFWAGRDYRDFGRRDRLVDALAYLVLEWSRPSQERTFFHQPLGDR